jgi:sulfotransferase
MKEINKEMIREEKKYYFLSGLPRSGSTLLSSILNQNPKMYSGPSSPVMAIMLALENAISGEELFLAFPKMAQAKGIISSVIENYYSDVDKPVIIDKNRSWVNRMHYIPNYFGIEPKILCPVRNMDEILTSFISMHRRNPMEINGRINFIDEMLIKSNVSLTDENRCEILSGPNGIVGQTYVGIQQAILEGKQKQLHFIEYDDLINEPRETMRKIYEFLGEDYFEHDFSNIKNIHIENDAGVYGFSDMHDVRGSLEKVFQDPKEILPEYIYEKCQGAEFWRDLNVDYTEEVEDYTTNKNESSNEDDTKLIGQ